MKNLFIASVVVLFCAACEKDDFNVEKPNVEKFVQQLNNGSYQEYETGDDGTKLWTIMPSFKMEHVELLLEFARDTSLVSPCQHFPVNPVSSIHPHRNVGSDECIMLGEYLLWVVDGIIAGKTFTSLVPVLVKEENESERQFLSGEEILVIREIYLDWWKDYLETELSDSLPLYETAYRWR